MSIITKINNELELLGEKKEKAYAHWCKAQDKKFVIAWNWKMTECDLKMLKLKLSLHKASKASKVRHTKNVKIFNVRRHHSNTEMMYKRLEHSLCETYGRKSL